MTDIYGPVNYLLMTNVLGNATIKDKSSVKYTFTLSTRSLRHENEVQHIHRHCGKDETL